MIFHISTLIVEQSGIIPQLSTPFLDFINSNFHSAHLFPFEEKKIISFYPFFHFKVFKLLRQSLFKTKQT